MMSEYGFWYDYFWLKPGGLEYDKTNHHEWYDDITLVDFDKVNKIKGAKEKYWGKRITVQQFR
jgi:hypothetical protein